MPCNLILTNSQRFDCVDFRVSCVLLTLCTIEMLVLLCVCIIIKPDVDVALSDLANVCVIYCNGNKCCVCMHTSRHSC